MISQFDLFSSRLWENDIRALHFPESSKQSLCEIYVLMCVLMCPSGVSFHSIHHLTFLLWVDTHSQLNAWLICHKWQRKERKSQSSRDTSDQVWRKCFRAWEAELFFIGSHQLYSCMKHRLGFYDPLHSLSPLIYSVYRCIRQLLMEKQAS